MMMSATKRYILKTHQINNSFYAYTEDSYSFFFTFQWSFWVVNTYLLLQTL